MHICKLKKFCELALNLEGFFGHVQGILSQYDIFRHLALETEDMVNTQIRTVGTHLMFDRLSNGKFRGLPYRGDQEFSIRTENIRLLEGDFHNIYGCLVWTNLAADMGLIFLLLYEGLIPCFLY